MSDLSVKQVRNNHKQELKNLREKNENELESIRLKHQKQLQNLQNQNRDQVGTVKLIGNERLLAATRENESKLMALQKNLDETREFVDKEKKRINSDFVKVKENRQKMHEMDLQNQNIKNSMVLDDLNHQAQTEIQKLQRKTSHKEDQIKRDHQVENKALRSHHLEKNAQQKLIFDKRHQHQSNKYQRAIQKQRFENQKTLAQAEQKNLKAIQSKEAIFSNRMAKLQQTREKTLAKKNAEFEKDFQHIQKTNQAISQKVLAKRENLLNELKKDLWQEFTLAAEKAKDPFYDFGKLDISVFETQDKKNYQVEVPAADHAASNIRMIAEKRSLKVMFDRKHEFTKETDSRKDSSFKTESYVSSFQVSDIVDPNSIKKDYRDGKVIFTIQKA